MVSNSLVTVSFTRLACPFSESKDEIFFLGKTGNWKKGCGPQKLILSFHIFFFEKPADFFILKTSSNLGANKELYYFFEFIVLS